MRKLWSFRRSVVFEFNWLLTMISTEHLVSESKILEITLPSFRLGLLLNFQVPLPDSHFLLIDKVLVIRVIVKNFDLGKGT